MTTNHLFKTGECESCETVGPLSLFMTIWMCEDCKAKEIQLQEASKRNAESRVTETRLQQARKIDQAQQVKTDYFNAATIAATELRAAIEQDEAIPADQKEYAYAKVCRERFEHMQQVILGKREELTKDESTKTMWLIQAQEAVGKLRQEVREEFKNLNVDYQPAKVKSVKPAAVKTPKQKFSMKEVREAAQKFNVPADGVQMIVVGKNMTPDAAAQFLAEQMKPTVQETK